ncbi:MAG: hypothetical protein RLZZ352_2300 [Pseudomonadota bacterium]|jgi:hypothetical protein
MIVIEEVIKRAEQGQTAPYMCRADDGQVYFVKSGALSKRELVAEWLAAHLAKEVGLPIPPFHLAEIPEALCDRRMGPWLKDLVPGVAFASHRVEGGDFAWSMTTHIPPQQRALIVAFDWWIHNADRTLSALGGNPNLLWRQGEHGGEVVVFDHNLAFELAFSAEAFLDSHVFAADLKLLAADAVAREQVRQVFVAALHLVQGVWANIPDAWHFADAEQTVRAAWNPLEFVTTLERCQDDQTFWNLTS